MQHRDPLGHGQAVLQPADKAGEICALCSVEGMEFVHYQKPQSLRPGSVPKGPCVPGGPEGCPASCSWSAGYPEGFRALPDGTE